jgi:rSAM/selenodomain-associated transferase 1
LTDHHGFVDRDAATNRLQRGAICIFAKAPRPGRVKTRLAAAIGARAAAVLARAFLEDTCALAASQADAEPIVALDGDLDAELRASLGPVAVWSQGEGDLGDRLERVLSRALVDHAWAVALGADSPGLPSALLTGAVRGLGSADAVLVPADDGGFCALALRRAWPEALRDVRWSSEHAMADVRARLESAGARVALTEPWFDVDGETDLLRLRGLLGRGALTAPATARALESLGRM